MNSDIVKSVVEHIDSHKFNMWHISELHNQGYLTSEEFDICADYLRHTIRETYSSDGFMWELSTGYVLWATKLRNKQKSYNLCVKEPNSDIFESIGLIKDIKKFKKAFRID